MATAQQLPLRSHKKLPTAGFGWGQERNIFVSNLALTLSAGTPLTVSLVALQKEVQSKHFKQALNYVAEAVENGSSLWQAFTDVALLPPYALALLRIGEESGTLGQNLQVIANEIEREQSLKSKIQSALAYPILVLAITVVVGIFISWFILPRFVTTFTTMHLTLPITTQWLLGFGTFLSRHGIVAVPLFLVGSSFLFYLIFFAPHTRRIGQWLIFHISIGRKIVQQTQLSRIGFLFGTLLQAGVPIDESIDSVSKAVEFYAYHDLLVTMKEQLIAGQTFQAVFAAYNGIDTVLPPTLQQMIITAEQSGNLPEIFLKISQLYEEKIDISTKTLATTLEPIMLVIVWLGVLFVAISVILPIYQLVGSVNQNSNSPSALSNSATPTVLPASPTPAITPLVSPIASPSL